MLCIELFSYTNFIGILAVYLQMSPSTNNRIHVCVFSTRIKIYISYILHKLTFQFETTWKTNYLKRVKTYPDT